MSRIVEVFGRRPVLLPVVHPASRASALASIDVAVAAGVPGIFLIDQGMTPDEVLELVVYVRALHPPLWIGVNLLARKPAAALGSALDACNGRIDGIWSDDAGIDERAPEQPHADAFLDARRARRWTGLYFGGTAFKYQREIADADLGRAAALAATYMDVVCTSGPGTGKAADPSKVIAMKRAIPNASLALASGVTAENAHAYTPYVDAFLVGTGIESSFGVLDRAKVDALLHAIS
ncbi:MAG: adenine phosphoribosyltransferase [Deltaproteobacteria bacterium]|nr:adenine phosphoribosyltransferase [Deltaproteobacteria bacterium]